MSTRPPVPASPAQASSTVRLNKRMAELGLCSRREADDWIERGWVRVDGAAATMGQQVSPQARITVERQARDQQADRVTILLHKPVGYVSGQAEDGHPPAVTLVQARSHWRGDHSPRRFQASQLRGLAPAGRLDIDSVGLLILTQDPQAIARLRHGLSLDGHVLKPAQVEWQTPEQLRFVLKEGRKRQIRRMCELVGLQVVGLKRIRIGRVMLGHLPVGQWRYLGPEEGF